MGHDKDQTKQTTGNMPRESSQGKGMDQGQAEWKPGRADWKPGDPATTPEGTWNDRSQREMQRGDQTKPAQPSGTNPLDKDQHPVNQTRPVQQNR
jgi:hypothetical protein